MQISMANQMMMVQLIADTKADGHAAPSQVEAVERQMNVRGANEVATHNLAISASSELQGQIADVYA